MRMTVGSRLRQSVRCPYCNSDDPENHAENCPRGILNALCDKQKNLECPSCGQHNVDVNARDLFECRNCNTQFSRSVDPLIDPVEDCTQVFLVVNPDDFIDGIIRVWQCKTKGTGDFPLDRKIEEVRARL